MDKIKLYEAAHFEGVDAVCYGGKNDRATD